MTLTKIGTVLALNGKPSQTDLQPLGVRARTPTIALNIDHFVTARPGIALQQGGASTLGKSARGRDNFATTVDFTLRLEFFNNHIPLQTQKSKPVAVEKHQSCFQS